ncbi:MAG: Nre family DNA repair protein [Thermoplasmata archaeon]
MFGALCVKCKGSRNLCGLNYCPLLDQVSGLLPKLDLKKTEFFGQAPPSVFIGRHNYPNVYVGPMVSDANREIGNPEEWYGREMLDIAMKASSLVRPSKIMNVHNVSAPSLEASQEIAMSSKPIDAEIILEKPYYSAKSKVDMFVHPMGPSVEMKSIRLVENPPVPRKVDYLVSDTDLKASKAVIYLYNSNIPFSQIQRILSVGLLGVKNERKMVPTRWSITATDDIIGKELIKEVKNFSLLEDYHVFYNNYVGNSFYILLIPRTWSFEMIELWQSGSFYANENVGEGDFEDYNGRKSYASNVEGAYYSARLAVLEYLKKIQRQASALVYREISPAYSIPLGVWVIRESVRAAMKLDHRTFESLSEAMSYINNRITGKNLFKKSNLISIIRSQRTLDDQYT